MSDEQENQPPGEEESVNEKVYLVDKAKKRKLLLMEVQLWGDKDTRRPRAGSRNQLPLRRGSQWKEQRPPTEEVGLEGESWSLESIAQQ